jgi:hypothetical protein
MTLDFDDFFNPTSELKIYYRPKVTLPETLDDIYTRPERGAEVTLPRTWTVLDDLSARGLARSGPSNRRDEASQQI